MVAGHPEDLLAPEAAALISGHACEAEAAGRLSGAVIELVHREQWLRMLIPERSGGLGWPLLRVVRVFEALAWADGNVGWCVNLGAGANMFAGYFQESVAKAIFTNPRVWCAGSGATGGVARRAEGGYIVSGYWKYASGAAHATHFTANCFLHDEAGRPVREEGEPVFRSIIVPRDAVTVQDTWKVTGLKATSSHDFSINEVFVPAEHFFSLLGPSAFSGGPLYQFPFEVMAVFNMASMATGIALHFIDLFKALISHKKPLHGRFPLQAEETVQRMFHQVTGEFYAARTSMYLQLEAAWSGCLAGEDQGGAAGQQMESARQAARAARHVVETLFPLCGMDIVFTNNPLNKVWRDMAVASQHYLLGPLAESRRKAYF